MSKSTRLLTATYILSYVASRAPEVVTTEEIASAVGEHPTRARQIVSALAKQGLLAASRGAAGGITLKRAASEISLRDVMQAVQDQSLLALHLFEPKSEWAGKSRVNAVFEKLAAELEGHIQSFLAAHTLDQTYAPIVVPFAPGGTTDILARTLGEHFGTRLGVTPLVRHLPASGRKGPQRGLRAHATEATVGGATLLIMTSSGALTATLADPQQRLAGGFEPVSLLAESEMILAVNMNSAWQTVRALVRSAKSRPAKLKFASVGNGSVSHLCAVLLEKRAGIELEHVAFAGAQPAVHALVAGEVDLYFGTPPTFLPHLRAGSVRALATTAVRQGQVLPDLPRVADDYSGFEVVGWHGVFAPPGTSAAVVKRLHRQVVDILSTANVRRRLVRQGFRPATSTPQELTRRIREEIAHWRSYVLATDLGTPPHGQPVPAA